MCDLNILLMA